MNHKLKKPIKIFIFSVLLIAIITSVTVFAIAYFYQDSIKSYIVKEINNSISTKINIDKINFSVFAKFPKASLEFVNITALSVDQYKKTNFKINTDTLFSAKSLFLEFNLIDILNEKYELNTIHLVDGKANMLVDKKGHDNFRFWNSDTSSNNNFEIKLQFLKFTNIQYKYINLYKDVSIQAYSDNLELAGDFSSNNYTLGTSGELIIDNFYFNKINYITTKDVAIELKLDVENNKFIIRDGDLRIADLRLKTNGEFTLNDNSTDLNINLSGKNIEIKSLISLLPKEYVSFKNDFSSEGKFYFNSSITGHVSNKKTAHINFDFGINNGVVMKRNSNIKIKNINLQGNYSTGKYNKAESSYLKINKFDAQMGQSSFNGTLKYENLIKPKIYLKSKVKINLSELQDFIALDTLKEMNGMLQGEIIFNGKIAKPNKFTQQDFKNSTTSGNLSISDANVKFKNSNIPFSNIDGKIIFNKNDIKLNDFSCNIQSNSITLNASLKNIISFAMLKNQELGIVANIKTDNLDILDYLEESTSSNKSKSAFQLPTNIWAKINLESSQLKYKKLIAKDITCNINYALRKIKIDNLKFKSLNGNAYGKLELSQIKKKWKLSINSNISNIDVSTVFSVFNNFDQTYITSKQLKGKTTANIDMTTLLDEDFNIQTKTLVLKSDFTISDGKLIDFKSLQELSSFVEVSELKKIQFKKLKNSLTIENEIIKIPEMEIKSSVADFNISGVQSFDGKLNYKLKIFLSDVLFKKMIKSKKHKEEFGPILDDNIKRIPVFLSIKGTTEKFNISYDKKEVKKKIKENIKEEKKTVKTILNEEFGFFKKDSAEHEKIKTKEKEKEKEKKKKKVQFNWNENDNKEKDRSNNPNF